MHRRIPRALVCATLLTVVVAACSTGGPATSPSTVPNADGSPASSPGASDLDRAFIDMMVPHHQAAVEMAKVALERTTREEVRALANDIVSAQESEIAQLREWRQAWFGSRDTPGLEAMPLLPGMDMPGMPGMKGGSMDMTADIKALRTADPFDRAFIEAMIPHHESAIAAAQIIAKATDRPELKRVAAGIIEAQQREIDQMRGWLAAWYPG